MQALSRIITSLKLFFTYRKADRIELIPGCGNQEFFRRQKQQEVAELKKRLKSLVRSGSRVEAMKEWRKYYRGSLKEAKAAIEAL